MRNNLAHRIAARRLKQAAPEDAARKQAFAEWELFHSRCHIGVGAAIRALDHFLMQVNSAFTRRKMVEYGDPENHLDTIKQMIQYSFEELDSALDALEKVQGLSGMGTLIGKLESNIVRADEKAYGLKL